MITTYRTAFDAITIVTTSLAGIVTHAVLILPTGQAIHADCADEAANWEANCLNPCNGWSLCAVYSGQDLLPRS